MRFREDRAAGLPGAIKPWRNRFMLKGALAWSLRGIGAGLGLTAALFVVARFVPWPDVFLWCIVTTVVVTAAGLLYSFFVVPSSGTAARQADLLLGLSDRLATAWEFRQSNSRVAWLQRQDALASIRAKNPAEFVRIWPGRGHFLSIIAGLALIGILVVLPNPMDRVIEQREQLEQRLAEAREELQKAKEETAGDDSPLSVEDRAAVEEALEKLEKALTEADTTPDALAALSGAEQEISLLQEPEIEQGKGLQDIGATLGTPPTTAALGRALHSRDEEAIRGAIASLADQLDSMSEPELQELSAALQRAANAATGNADVAGSLRHASRAIATGDPGVAEAAFAGLAGSLAALQNEVEASEAIDRTLSGLRGARSFISGVAVAQTADGMAAGPGRRDGGNGGAAGAGQGAQGGSGIGPGGDSGGSGAGNQPGDRQGEGSGRLPAEGETVFVPGQGPDIPTEVRTGPGAGIAPGRLRPYNEVLGQYTEQAREHMERSPVPQGYKELVRRYFAGLEP